MHTTLTALGVWTAISVPCSLVVGAWLGRRSPSSVPVTAAAKFLSRQERRAA